MTHETPPPVERRRWGKLWCGLGAAAGYLMVATGAGAVVTAAHPSSTEVGIWWQLETRTDLKTFNQIPVETLLGPALLEPQTERITFAPGFAVLPHLQPNVIDSFEDNGNKLTNPMPTEAEIAGAIRSISLEMGVKFAAGGLAATLIYGALLQIMSGRKLSKRILRESGAAALAATSLVAIAAFHAYGQGDLEPRAEGNIGKILANTDIFKDLSEQSDNMAGKLSAMLALVNSIEAESESELKLDGTSFVLVADTHGEDISSTVKASVEQHRASAVIIAGDLLNYGTVAELEAAGIPEGLESIGVPVIIVTGNHDKTRPNDTAVLERLAKIKNVTLLQTDENNYTVVRIGGVEIGGFHDPRNAFDGQIKSDVNQQVGAAEDFLNSVPLDELDIVVTHEQFAAEPINKTANEWKPLVVINGHGHRPDLHKINNSYNIEVGSATAGGIFNNGRYDLDGKKIRDIDDRDLHSYDILTFGADCVAKQLTRVQYTTDVPRQLRTEINMLKFANVEPSDRTCAPEKPIEFRSYVFKESDPGSASKELKLEEIPYGANPGL